MTRLHLDSTRTINSVKRSLEGLSSTFFEENQRAILGGDQNPYRFQNGRQVLKTAGFTLSAERSGKSSERAVPVISKRGKADLRFDLYQAALIASVRNRDFIGYYTEKLHARKRSGDPDQDAGEAGGQDVDDCLGVDEEKGPFDPSYLRAAGQSFWNGVMERGHPLKGPCQEGKLLDRGLLMGAF